MSVEVEPPRARPLSGTLWTLFSWLRRDSSSESLSSVGSDRTAASFAFLPPGHYAGPNPLTVPPPGPPTDSYKKRVRDRNFRRHNERDITLLRKYGLHGFDAFSLPNARRLAAGDRDRRATSELLQHVHVPGKRRAPQPPATNSLHRRRARKRPAPQPPLAGLPEKPEEAKDIDIRSNNTNSLPMNSQRTPDKQTLKQSEVMGCKSEKYSKKETITKDVKPRQDKSFLKQIFENKKRNSAIETSSVKLLPSISELDKQAHEIIEKYKLKELNHNTQEGRLVNESPGSSKQAEAWICTRCLRKYNASVITCLYCLPLENALFNNSSKSSRHSNNSTQTNNQKSLEEKEKLKEILKEMKDSLPKYPVAGQFKFKNTNLNEVKEPQRDQPRIEEASTLRIGSNISTGSQNAFNESDSPIRINYTKEKTLATIENVSVTQPAVLIHTKENLFVNNKRDYQKEVLNNSKQTANVAKKRENSNLTKTQIASKILSSKISVTKEETYPKNDKVLVTQPVVLEHTKNNIVVVGKEKVSMIETSDKSKPSVFIEAKFDENETRQASNILSTSKMSNTSSDPKTNIENPMKLSSLLNPIYVPKTPTTGNATSKKEETCAKNANVNETKPVTANNVSNNLPLGQVSKSNQISISTVADKPCINAKKDEDRKQSASPKDTKFFVKNTVEKQIINSKNVEGPNPGTSQGTAEIGIIEKLDQHSRRRNLINQLEQSIAKGDERAAADAAVKLAQLRLSCSVLSFSSQIVADASTPSAEPHSSKTSFLNGTTTASNKSSKVDETPNTSQSNTDKVTPVTTPTPKELTNNRNFNDNMRNAKLEEKKERIQTEVPTGTNIETATPKQITVLNKPTIQKKDVAVQNTVRPSTSKDDNAMKNSNEDVPILVWVEDKEATRGPVQIHVCRAATMGDLRRRAEASLGLAARMQRWIVGRALCCDDASPLVALAGPDLTAPFYLCLVESDTKEPNKPEDPLAPVADTDVYTELVKLEQRPLVSNTDAFECGVCMERCAPGGGVVLRECVHSFCVECLSHAVRHSEEPVVACPAVGCPAVLQEREVKGLVSPEEYEKWLARGLAVAESGSRHAFHCRTRDCAGWALCEPGVRRFPCPVCERLNCVPCQAIHEGETCEQHRAKLATVASGGGGGGGGEQTDEGTRALLTALIARGEALECPECSAIITKKWGCDWVKCSACKTEICWVTRGRRWGAAGRGDTSGGCRCGVDGNKCHPSCGYCH